MLSINPQQNEEYDLVEFLTLVKIEVFKCIQEQRNQCKELPLSHHPASAIVTSLWTYFRVNLRYQDATPDEKGISKNIISIHYHSQIMDSDPLISSNIQSIFHFPKCRKMSLLVGFFKIRIQSGFPYCISLLCFKLFSSHSSLLAFIFFLNIYFLGHLLQRLSQILDMVDHILTVLIICVCIPHISGKLVITSKDFIRFGFSLIFSKSTSEVRVFKHDTVETTFRKTLFHIISSSNYKLFYLLPIHS